MFQLSRSISACLCVDPLTRIAASELLKSKLFESCLDEVYQDDFENESEPESSQESESEYEYEDDFHSDTEITSLSVDYCN